MEIEPHHVKAEVCSTRPKYREGKKPKVVKVYTCAQESKYLLVRNVPALGVHNELIKLFSIYGAIEEHKFLNEYPCEQFTEAILIKFVKIQNSRTAKIKLDDYNFYGNTLHVCYAPEHESLDDLREKLNERKNVIKAKCEKYDSIKFGTVEYDLSMKSVHNWKKKRKLNASEKFTTKETAKEKESESQANKTVCYPQLPEGWVKPTATGDASYDETVTEIRNKMKQTITHQQPVIFKKRKKTLRL